MNVPANQRSFQTGASLLVRDAKSGRVLSLSGYGSMKGEFVLQAGIDLSKPIAAQVLHRSRKRA